MGIQAIIIFAAGCGEILVEKSNRCSLGEIPVKTSQEMIGKEVGDHFILEIEGKDVKFTVKAIEKVEIVKL